MLLGKECNLRKVYTTIHMFKHLDKLFKNVINLESVLFWMHIRIYLLGSFVEKGYLLGLLSVRLFLLH